MPNVRLRRIYLAIMQARAVARARPARRGERSTLGLEACLVSPAIDLGPGDLLSDAIGGPVVEFLRASPSADRRKRPLTADCGAAARLPGEAGSVERIWTAVGAAAALQSLSSGAKSPEGTSAQVGVAVIYISPDELPSTLLKNALAFARDHNLPLVLVTLPPAVDRKSLASPLKAAALSDLAIRCGVPAIPTDATDAVAIYRVAQESIGHARAGGGPALIECIPFLTSSVDAKRSPQADAVSLLEQYVLSRSVVNRAWIDREARVFARRLASEDKASK